MDNTKFENTVKQAIQAPNGLAGDILSQKIILAIEQKKRAQALMRLVIFGMLTLVFVVIGILDWRTEVQIIANSGIGQILSLLFSDFGMVTSFWREYLSSVAGSLPFVSVAIIGALIWASVVSAYELIKNGLFLINNLHHYEKY